MVKVLVIDGQGGRVGRQLAELLMPYDGTKLELTVVGTNAAATANMIKSGAVRAATGENPIIVNARRADVIAGPVGIVIADSLLGEVTPASACAVGQSGAVKVLLPVNRCDNIVVGVRDASFASLIAEAADEILAICGADKA